MPPFYYFLFIKGSALNFKKGFDFEIQIAILSCSIMSFAESTGDTTIKMVDNMLDALTNGEHSKVQWQIDQVNIFSIHLHFTNKKSVLNLISTLSFIEINAQ